MELGVGRRPRTRPRRRQRPAFLGILQGQHSMDKHHNSEGTNTRQTRPHHLSLPNGGYGAAAALNMSLCWRA